MLYVDDPTDSHTQELINAHITRTTEAFWSAATKLCPDHVTSSYARCDNCIFDLDFFPFFPEALYALLEKRYFVYLVDINSEEVDLNRWDNNKYTAKADQFREQLRRWFRHLTPGALIDGQNHLIPAISRLRHKLNPFTVWWSGAYDPKEALKLENNISHIGRKGEDLDGVLASAVNWLKLQMLDGLHVPLPRHSQPSLSDDRYLLDYPIYVDFKQQQLRITTGVELTNVAGEVIAPPLPSQLGPIYTRPIPGGIQRGLTLRYLVRGGRIPKVLDQEHGSRLLGLDSGTKAKQAEAELERNHPNLKSLRLLIEKKVERDNNFSFWNTQSGIYTMSSVELAWRYLYHAIVQLYLHSRSTGMDLSEFKGEPLTSDAELLTESNPLLIAKQFVETAIELGTDELAVQCADFEMLWIPYLVSVCVEMEETPESDISSQCQELRIRAPIRIVDDMLTNGPKKDKKFERIAFFEHWYDSDSIYGLLRVLYDIENKNVEKHELKISLFRLYSNAKSLHEQAILRR